MNGVAALLVLLLLPALVFISPLEHRAAAAPFYYTCSNITFKRATSFDRSLNLVLATLERLSSFSMFNNTTQKAGVDEVYGKFQCQGDLSLPECSNCISQIVNETTSSCPNAIGAQVLDDACFLRYENQSFVSLIGISTLWGWNTANDTDETFTKNVDSVLNKVITAAPKNGGFSASHAGESVTARVYGLAQCFGYLSQVQCSECLSRVSGFRQLSHLGYAAGGRVYYSDCYFRYEKYLFFNESKVVTTTPAIGPVSVTSSPRRESPPNHLSSGTRGKSKRKTTIIVGVTVASGVTLVLCMALAIWRRKHAKRMKRDAQSQAGGDLNIQISRFQQTAKVFTMNQLKEATREFHPDNKLGEGGFGVVYKGILEDGQLVAIKKLSVGSRQGKQQFLNEVSLLSTVQHRNLIKLYGCCAEGSERLVVYEFLPKKSLDTHLFDCEDSVSLDWHSRREIIIGTAKGLAYLHDDSPMRIVHRDIKASNILLDDNLNAKIADFGLARLFSGDESHVSTGVAGTLGYLAPEYAMHGQLTEKADVFSFGLVCLEIVSGRRNTEPRLPPEKQRILEWAWTLYRYQRQLELADPGLGGNFFAEEVVRVVHVALLCTQAEAGLRPSMSKVVLMLVGRSEILERPTRPPYISANSDTEVEMERNEIPSRNVNMSYIPPTSTVSSSSSSSTGSGPSSSYTPLLRDSQANVSISDVAEPR